MGARLQLLTCLSSCWQFLFSLSLFPVQRHHVSSYQFSPASLYEVELVARAVLPLPQRDVGAAGCGFLRLSRALELFLFLSRFPQAQAHAHIFISSRGGSFSCSFSRIFLAGGLK